jgi:hypothetical protein
MRKRPFLLNNSYPNYTLAPQSSKYRESSLGQIITLQEKKTNDLPYLWQTLGEYPKCGGKTILPVIRTPVLNVG